MGKKQNGSENKNDLFFLFSILVIIIISFLLFVPKVANTLFLPKREFVLQSFLGSVRQANRVDPQKFWEFREFYSPGYFIFNKNGLSQSQIKAVESKIGVSISTKYIDRIFLTFTSPHLTSFEAFVTTNDLSNILTTPALNRKQIIFSDKNTLVYKDNKQLSHIIFLKQLSEMERANGFFNYSDTDKNLAKGKNWLEVTTLDEK